MNRSQSMMQCVLAIVAWIGLVTGQVFPGTGTTCSQASSGCQSSAYGPYGPLGSGCVGAGTPFTTSRTGCTRASSCLSQNSVPIPLTEFYLNQPIYTRIVQNSEASQYIDNVCNTFAQVPDNDKTFIVYSTTVYTDGTSSTETSVILDLGGGNYLRANPDFIISERSPAQVGELLVSCTQPVYGDSTYPSLLVTTFGSRPPISLSCVQQVQQAYNNAGLGSCDTLYVLPYRLPSQCVQPSCSPVNPLVQVNSQNNYYMSTGFNYNGGSYGNTCL